MKNDKGDLELKQSRRTLSAEMRQWSNFGWVEKLNGRRKGAGSERKREREREKERERRPM